MTPLKLWSLFRPEHRDTEVAAGMKSKKSEVRPDRISEGLLFPIETVGGHTAILDPTVVWNMSEVE